MKIVIVSTYPPKGEKHSNTGGVSSYTKNLTTNLPQESGDELYVLCDKIDGKYDSYKEERINVIRCFDKNVKCFTQVLKEIWRIKPDVIHIQQELSLYGGILNAYLLQWFIFLLRKYKVVITIHGIVSLKSITKEFIKGNNAHTPVWLTKAAFYIIYRPLCVWSDRVIVHEDCFKKTLSAEYNVKGSKIHILPHGVEKLEALSKDVARKKLNLPQDSHVVLFVGYLTGYKGIDLLIEGFSEYTKVDSKAFLIIGAGEHPKFKNEDSYISEYQRLVAKAKNMIPATQYSWNGFVKEKDVQLYYSAADASVFPYTTHLSSSGPMALSIGYGTPFLASDVFSEFIKNEKLCFSREKEDFSVKFKDFFEDPHSCDEYFQQVRNELLWDAVATSHKALYVDLYE